MIPAAAIAGLGLGSKLLGGWLGANAQDDATQRGMDQFRQYTQQGTDVLNKGKIDTTAAFDPYTSAGKFGVGGFKNAISNRIQAQMPSLTNSSPTQALSFLDPSANFTSNQAMKAAEASAIAKGGMGGGLAKALSNNANQMAMTNYNNAFQQMLNANNQNFGQQQQNYQNKTDYDQSQIGNWGNLSNLGLTATGQNQNLLSKYNTDINQNYNDIANAMYSGNNQQGKTRGDMWNSMGSNLASGISSIFGA